MDTKFRRYSVVGRGTLAVSLRSNQEDFWGAGTPLHHRRPAGHDLKALLVALLAMGSSSVDVQICG